MYLSQKEVASLMIGIGTAHCLGTKFAKMYNIVVEDPSGKQEDGQSQKIFV